MYYLSLEIQNLHPIVIRAVRCVKGVMFLSVATMNFIITRILIDNQHRFDNGFHYMKKYLLLKVSPNS